MNEVIKKIDRFVYIDSRLYWDRTCSDADFKIMVLAAIQMKWDLVSPDISFTFVQLFSDLGIASTNTAKKNKTKQAIIDLIEMGVLDSEMNESAILASNRNDLVKVSLVFPEKYVKLYQNEYKSLLAFAKKKNPLPVGLYCHLKNRIEMGENVFCYPSYTVLSKSLNNSSFNAIKRSLDYLTELGLIKYGNSGTLIEDKNVKQANNFYVLAKDGKKLDQIIQNNCRSLKSKTGKVYKSEHTQDKKSIAMQINHTEKAIVEDRIDYADGFAKVEKLKYEKENLGKNKFEEESLDEIFESASKPEESPPEPIEANTSHLSPVLKPNRGNGSPVFKESEYKAVLEIVDLSARAKKMGHKDCVGITLSGTLAEGSAKEIFRDFIVDNDVAFCDEKIYQVLKTMKDSGLNSLNDVLDILSDSSDSIEKPENVETSEVCEGIEQEDQEMKSADLLKMRELDQRISQKKQIEMQKNKTYEQWKKEDFTKHLYEKPKERFRKKEKAHHGMRAGLTNTSETQEDREIDSMLRDILK